MYYFYLSFIPINYGWYTVFGIGLALKFLFHEYNWSAAVFGILEWVWVKLNGIICVDFFYDTGLYLGLW
jgi:hypothetical protein